MLPIKDDNRENIFPFWVIIIILANLYVFYLELISPKTDIFISEYALIPASENLADTATLLPFITSQFLHGGFLFGWFTAILFLPKKNVILTQF